MFRRLVVELFKLAFLVGRAFTGLVVGDEPGTGDTTGDAGASSGRTGKSISRYPVLFFFGFFFFFFLLAEMESASSSSSTSSTVVRVSCGCVEEEAVG